MKNEYTIGIDIGGTGTVLGAVSAAGEVVAEAHFPTRDYPHFDDYPAYVTRLAEAIGILQAQLPAGAILRGVGIGAPDTDGRHGVIDRPVNLWKFRPDEANPDEERRIFPLVCDLQRLLSDRPPLRIANDANAAAWGEHIYGAARDMRDFVVVTLGTGLGSGFVANGALIEGSDGMAGELGHVIVEPGGRLCGCGRRGCLETYVSATGLCRTVIELLENGSEPSTLQSIPRKRLEAHTVAEAAAAGDALALEAMRRTGERLGLALANVVSITSPEAVILFGGLVRAGELLFGPTRRALEENLSPIRRGRVPLLPSALLDRNAGVLGAAALIG